MADTTEYKVVVQGLPFEAKEEDIVSFFQLKDKNQLDFKFYPDSGRCRGFSFITFPTQDEYDACLNKSGELFECMDKSRTITVKVFQEREAGRRGSGRGRGRGRGQRRGGREGASSQGAKPQYDSPQEYKEDETTEREIYVSNVPFKATKEDFEQVFGVCGEIEEINIPRKYSTGLPKGFAFVRFKTPEEKNEALKLHDTKMLERTIGVRANRGRAQKTRAPKEKRDPEKLSEKPAGCCTIYVGNLPFTTQEDDLKEVFDKCGEIKNVRIVKQHYTGKSRGFGYVEFMAEASVDTAVQMSPVLEERTLRLDYAENLNTQ